MTQEIVLSFGDWAFLNFWFARSPSPPGNTLQAVEEKGKHIRLLRKVRRAVAAAKDQGLTELALPLCTEEREDLIWGLGQIDWSTEGEERAWEVRERLGWVPPLSLSEE